MSIENSEKQMNIRDLFLPVKIVVERRNNIKTLCLLSEVREMAKSFILMQSIRK